MRVGRIQCILHDIIEPYFFDQTVNSRNYLEMLRNHVHRELGRRKRRIRSTIFMQDWAPAHYATEVHWYLEATFGAESVISRRYQRNWPSRSPDLTPVDNWRWGTLKARIFTMKARRVWINCDVAFKKNVPE